MASPEKVILELHQWLSEKEREASEDERSAPADLVILRMKAQSRKLAFRAARNKLLDLAQKYGG